MKMLRRTSPPPPAPPVPSLDPKGDEGLTRRRVEVIVEREWARESIPGQPISGAPTPATSFEAHCAACGQRVTMYPPAAAALIAGVTVRTIYRLVDEKKLHFLESPAGDLYLCARTLQAPAQPPASTKELPSGDPR
jgi:hypothetical protein